MSQSLKSPAPSPDSPAKPAGSRPSASFVTRVMARPELGALIAAVGVGLLMIGGEFDLSAGVAAITYGLTTALLCYQLTLNMWVGAIVSLALVFAIGWLNGYLVVRTGIPS